APGIARRILLHFKRAGRHATGIGGLARPEQGAGTLEHMHGIRRARHIGALTHRHHTVLHQRARILAGQFVLRRRRHRDIARHVPDATLRYETGALAALGGVINDPATATLLDVLEQIEIDAGLVADIAVGIRTGDDLAAEFAHLFHG